MIILEGPDNAGKSTLARTLGLRTIHPGAPPKSEYAERELFIEQQSLASEAKAIVYDRVTCISQQVYQQRLFDSWYMAPLIELIDTEHCIVVYCRPPKDILLDFSKHVTQAHDTVEQMAYVRKNANQLVDSYDRLMRQIIHVTYDFTVHPVKDLIDMIIPTQYSKMEWVRCTNMLKAML